MKPKVIAAACLLGFLPGHLLAAEATVDPAETDPDVRLLQKYQFGAEAEGVTKLLRWVQGDASSADEVATLIAGMGHTDFRHRESAAKKLSQLGFVPAELLEGAMKSPDPEIAARAHRVHKLRAELDRDRPPLIAAALRLIASKQLQVPTEVLLMAPPHLDSAKQRDRWVKAIAAVVTGFDLIWMEEALAGEDPLRRLAAMRGLPRADPAMALPLLSPLVDDEDLSVAFPAALGLVEIGDRTLWKALLAWTRSEDEQRRVRAVQLLRTATGKNFRLDPFKPPASQEEQRTAWSNWISEQGDLAAGSPAPRYRPVRLKGLAEDLHRGLLAHYSMDGIKAGVLEDQSGGGKDGMLRGKHDIVDGALGKAVRFQGLGETGTNGGHADIPFIDFNQLPAFTVALWVRFEDIAASKHGEAFFCHGFDQAFTRDGALCIGFFFDTIHFRTGTGMVSIPHPPADRKRWVHYAMSYEDGHLSVFKDGLLAGDRKLTVDVKGNKAALGRHWWQNGAETSTRLVGALDDVRVYDRALDEYQIAGLHAKDAAK
jgi:hypothetical protein